MRIIGYIGLMCIVVNTHAAALVAYTFDGATGSEETFDAHTVAENIMASSMSRGAGLTAVNGVGTFNSSSWSGALFEINDDYLSFTLTPNPGFKYTLETIQFDERRSATGPRFWAMTSSVLGFDRGVGFFAISDNTSTRSQVVPVASLFDDITESVEFRFNAFSSEGDAGTWRIDNVKLFGTITPVPEPQAWIALIGTGLFGWALYRRK